MDSQDGKGSQATGVPGNGNGGENGGSNDYGMASAVPSSSTKTRNRNTYIMGTRNYKLYSAGVGTASAVASIKITRPGSITGIWHTQAGMAGAGGGYMQTEVSLQSAANIGVNDTPATVLSEHAIQFTTSTPSQSNAFHGGLLQSVAPGDTIYVHQAITGTAPSSSHYSAFVAVNER